MKDHIQRLLRQLRQNRSTSAPRVTEENGHIRVGPGGGRLRKDFRSSGQPKHAMPSAPRSPRINELNRYQNAAQVYLTAARKGEPLKITFEDGETRILHSTAYKKKPVKHAIDLREGDLPTNKLSDYRIVEDPASYNAGKTYSENHVDRQYKKLLREILENGYPSSDRTGTGTKKVIGRQMRFDLQEGFPLLTTKKVWFEGVAKELLFFLRGQTNAYYLEKEGVGIWTPNVYAKYKKTVEESPLSDDPMPISDFRAGMMAHPPLEDDAQYAGYGSYADIWGDIAPYGKAWRKWPTPYGTQFDQIQNLIEGLNENPTSRRHIVQAWNPAEHNGQNKTHLPPCHIGFQCVVRPLTEEEQSRYGTDIRANKPLPEYGVSLIWKQRSVDVFLGLPFNIASYALLTHMIAQQTGMIPLEVIFQGADVHLYNNHTDQAEEQLSRTAHPDLPTLRLERAPAITEYTYQHMTVNEYDCHPKISAPIAT